MTPEWISKIIAGFIILCFWLVAGIMLAPFWLLVVITGALIGAFEWKETPRMFLDLITIKWWWDAKP